MGARVRHAHGELTGRLDDAVSTGLAGEITIERSDLMRELGRALQHYRDPWDMVGPMLAEPFHAELLGTPELFARMASGLGDFVRLVHRCRSNGRAASTHSRETCHCSAHLQVQRPSCLQRASQGTNGFVALGRKLGQLRKTEPSMPIVSS